MNLFYNFINIIFINIIFDIKFIIENLCNPIIDISILYKLERGYGIV